MILPSTSAAAVTVTDESSVETASDKCIVEKSKAPRAISATAVAKTDDASPTHVVLSFIFSGQIPVMDYLGEDPLDVLKLLYVSKNFRKVAANKLRQLQQEPATAWKQQCFDQWLVNPTFGSKGGDNAMYKVMCDANSGLAGPLRMEAVAMAAKYFQQRFIVLNYQREYYSEECVLAIVNNDGILFQVIQFQCSVDASKCDTDMPDPIFQDFFKRGIYWKCDHFSLSHSKDWSYRNMGDASFMKCTALLLDKNGDILDTPISFASTDFSLITRLDLQGVLSPTEVVCVLWHALSGDATVILEYLHSFYDGGFQNDLQRWPCWLTDPSNDNAHAYTTLADVRECLEFWKDRKYNMERLKESLVEWGETN